VPEAIDVLSGESAQILSQCHLPQTQPCCPNQRTAANGVFVLAGPVQRAVGPDDPSAEAFTA
jgi:hypothetical protein